MSARPGQGAPGDRAPDRRASGSGVLRHRALGPGMPPHRALGPGASGGGFALVPALFLLVVLGALGLVAIRVGGGQQQTVTMNLMQARALAAANAGIEWGAYSAINGLGCAAGTTLNLTEGALNGFVVAVNCTSTTFINGAGTNNAFVIKATSTFGTYGQPGYVKRVVSGSFSDATS